MESLEEKEKAVLEEAQKRAQEIVREAELKAQLILKQAGGTVLVERKGSDNFKTPDRPTTSFKSPASSKEDLEDSQPAHCYINETIGNEKCSIS